MLLFFLIFVLQDPLIASAANPHCTLALTATPSSQTIVKGGNVTYSFALKNTGTGKCTSTSLSVYYDTNERYISGTHTPSGSTNYYWYIGTLQAGETYTLGVTTRNQSTASTTMQNGACSSATGAVDSCVSTAVTVGIAAATSPAPDSATSREFGTWIWTSPYALTWDKSTQYIDAAAANGFNAIYITIDDYLSINALPDSDAKASARTAYTDAVYRFIAYAHQKNIAVDAEAGDRDWAENTATGNADAILDFIISYNSTHDAKFRNVQYDIEPYLLPNYETNKAAILTNYVALTSELVSRNNSPAGITMVIPHFYGSVDRWTPTISHGRQTGSAFALILGILDSKPANMINIMAYRNYASGAGGTIDIASDELAEASQGGHRTKIVVAQETGNMSPSYVTFYGMVWQRALFLARSPVSTIISTLRLRLAASQSIT